MKGDFLWWVIDDVNGVCLVDCVGCVDDRVVWGFGFIGVNVGKYHQDVSWFTAVTEMVFYIAVKAEALLFAIVHFGLCELFYGYGWFGCLRMSCLRECLWCILEVGWFVEVLVGFGKGKFRLVHVFLFNEFCCINGVRDSCWFEE